MKQYHYSDGVNSYGPISLEELKTKNIGPETLIWSEDLVTWTKAKDIAELKGFFNPMHQAPPLAPQTSHIPNDNFNQHAQRPPKTYLIESILTTIFCCWPLGIPAIVYASRVEKKFYSGDIAGAERDSANAKKWMVINLVACVILWIGYLGFFGLAMLGAII